MKTLLLSVLLGVMLTPAYAEPDLICQYGGTMILTVPRADYDEEPRSILKIVIWNGETMGPEDSDICSIPDVGVITYFHTHNKSNVNGAWVDQLNSYDSVMITPFSLFEISEPDRNIEEGTREIFYVYDRLLG